MRIEDSVRKLWEAKQKQKKIKEYVEAVEKKENIAISNYMFSNLPKGTESFVVRLDDGETLYMNPVTVRVTRVRKKIMVWNIEKLMERLSYKKYQQIVKKRYSITDIDGLVEYLKSCGADPKKFKKFISVEKEVNEPEIDKMLELGEVTMSEISGCYEVKIGEPYFRLTELKR